MAIVLSAPLSQQLQPKFLALTQLYEARERASKMYSWPVFVITAILVEIPFNIVACVAIPLSPFRRDPLPVVIP